MIKWLLLFLVLRVLSELLSVLINSNPEQLWWWTEWKKWDGGARVIVFFRFVFLVVFGSTFIKNSLSPDPV